MQRVGWDGVTCRKGCTHCCHYPLAISLWEGISIYQALKEEGQWRPPLKASLEHHSGQTLGASAEIWLLAAIPCPLLADGMCTVYAHRPFRCRVTTSSRNPDLCRPASFGPDTFIDNQPERLEFALVEQRAAKTSRDHVRAMNQQLPVSTAVLLAQQLVEGIIPLAQIPSTLLRLLERSFDAA